MRRSLIDEFAKTVNSKVVYKELSRTKKQNDETYQEYVYRMMEIASHADIEMEAKIQYIIEGIPDDPVNKAILYAAYNIKSLRKKLSQYETMKACQRPTSSKAQSTKPEFTKAESTKSEFTKPGKEMKSGIQRSQDVKRCGSCAGKYHATADCPTKEKGVKCFQCQGYGHIAAKCEKGSGKQVNECNNPTVRDRKVYKIVTIGNKRLIALLDTGSDLHLMKAEQYIMLGSLSFTGPAIAYKGIGKDGMMTLGSFVTDVEIDDSDFSLTIHVVSDVAMNHNLLIGSGLLRDANIQLIGNNALVAKRNESVKTARETPKIPEIFCIDIRDTESDSDSERQIDFSNIRDPLTRSEVQNLVTNYELRGTKQSEVELQIVLKDEVPVYQHPRRLAPVEKFQVNEQIKVWLRDGIIRPSVSEYASSVVLVKKKNVKKDQNSCKNTSLRRF